MEAINWDFVWGFLAAIGIVVALGAVLLLKFRIERLEGDVEKLEVAFNEMRYPTHQMPPSDSRDMTLR